MNNINDRNLVKEKIYEVDYMSDGIKRILIIWGILGDFDSIEYAQRFVEIIPEIESKNIKFMAIAIGDQYAKNKFVSYTGFPEEKLFMKLNSSFHDSLRLSKGLQLSHNSWVDLILMCAGIGSPGTLKEVIRGYLGDLSSKAIYNKDDIINIGGILKFNGSLFDILGKNDRQRPLELATLRLTNMIEVFSAFNVYFKYKNNLTQRGATFLLDKYSYIDYSFFSKALLDYSPDMSNPLDFIVNWSNDMPL